MLGFHRLLRWAHTHTHTLLNGFGIWGPCRCFRDVELLYFAWAMWPLLCTQTGFELEELFYTRKNRFFSLFDFFRVRHSVRAESFMSRPKHSTVAAELSRRTAALPFRLVF